MSDFRSFLKDKGKVDNINIKDFKKEDFKTAGFTPNKMELDDKEQELTVYYDYDNKPVGTKPFQSLKVVKDKGLKVASSFGSKKTGKWLVVFTK